MAAEPHHGSTGAPAAGQSFDGVVVIDLSHIDNGPRDLPSGVMSFTGFPDRPPMKAGAAPCDFIAGVLDGFTGIPPSMIGVSVASLTTRLPLRTKRGAGASSGRRSTTDMWSSSSAAIAARRSS